MTELKLHIGHPGLTLLHRAGLAGLWMTLKQIEQEIPPEKRPGSLTWELTPRQVQLFWQGNDFEVIDWLLKESFQLNNGLIALRGIDSKSMRKDSQVIIHQGILGTFLQHNKTRKILGEQTESLEIDENYPPIIIKYKALESYVHQEFAKNLCDKDGNWLRQPISIAGWLNPGAVVRHNAFPSDTSFEESPEMAFILLYAPVSSFYYILRSRLKDQKAQYALVVPEITDMEVYAGYRQDPRLRYASYRDLHAAGLGDAGLKFLTYQEVAESSRGFKVTRCQVLTLGSVPWSKQQKSRTDLFTVEAKYHACKNYQICKAVLPDRVILKTKAEEGSFIATSFAREMIAENLARDHPWYAGFSDWVNSNERFKQLCYERRGLSEMVMRADMDDRERWFVQTCHEAIRFTYGRLYQKAQDRGEQTNFDRENVRIRTGLARCKNAESFREFITNFWAKAGIIPTLQEHWDDLMDLVMDPKEWRKARDLALLALASYKGKERQEETQDEPDENGTDLIAPAELEED
ncbi:type I-MYXAN CRISPR-associated Cas8a1/Cmx1 [Synechococcus sp. H55.8]|uniref:type I-MYXAN CRISPR-associated Cas8a1/Cmx1 n=1 Tax=Synechococcus sp. H55.8 TaxID=2964510 RepID=UPI0039C36E11